MVAQCRRRPKAGGVVQSSLFPPVGDIVAKFLRGVGIAIEHKLTSFLENEELAIQNVTERAIGRCVALVALGLNRQHPDHARMFVRSDHDLWNRMRRP